MMQAVTARPSTYAGAQLQLLDQRPASPPKQDSKEVGDKVHLSTITPHRLDMPPCAPTNPLGLPAGDLARPVQNSGQHEKKGKEKGNTRVSKPLTCVRAVTFVLPWDADGGRELGYRAFSVEGVCRAVDGAPVPFRNVVPAAVACHALGLPLPGLSGWAWRLCSALESAREWMFGVDFGCGEMSFGAVMLLRRPDAVRTWGYAACGEAVFFHKDCSYVCTNGVVGGTGAQHANDGGLPSSLPQTRPQEECSRNSGTYCKSAAGPDVLYKQPHEFPDFVPPRHESDPRPSFKSTLHPLPPITGTKQQTYRLPPIPNHPHHTHTPVLKSPKSRPQKPDSGPFAPASQRPLASR
ncbi:hypothetical protein V500_04159 [Pseudogymnoascus sp. VKM F-4518 (FW-2643)]|nr:hypothetical protein V500_04159 [Pseudogymnoascus sp. VKM F-4518 (FW-2643)]